jgi:hypothetical protein
MIRGIHKSANMRVKCHQIWTHIPDPFTKPLPVFVAIWRQSGDRGRRLRLLTGAGDRPGTRKSQVAKVTTRRLGTGCAFCANGSRMTDSR